MRNSTTLDLDQRYNQIKFIHQQRDWISLTSFRDAISHLAQIFVRHQAHLNFAIALLHRHHQLPPGYAMVHSRGVMNEDHCNMEELGTRPIFPCAYHCCLDGAASFAPYEFTSTPVPMPDEAFLSEVAAYLIQYDLCGVVGISHMVDADQVWLESQTLNGQGTIAVVNEERQILPNGDYTVTEWAVTQDVTGVKIVEIKACNDKESGHTRT